MDAIIKSHNATVLSPTPVTEPRLCSCPKAKKADCPLGGKCLTRHIVYRADVIVEGRETKCYYGIADTTFKERYNNHTSSFRHRKNSTKTALSIHLWNLKDSGIEYTLKWSTARHAAPYKCGTRKCDLCLTESAIIMAAEQRTLINKKAEVVKTCRHRTKFIFG